MSRRHKHHARRRSHEDSFARSPNPKRFYRSKEDSVIAGICGGLADRFGWDPLPIRIGMAIALFAGLPFILIGYIVVWVITPTAPSGYRDLGPEEDAFWRGVSDRPRATFGHLKYTFMDLDDRLQSLERTVTSDEWRLRKEFRDLEGRS